MSGELRARHMEGERWKMEARLADPPSTLEGECWIRPDLAPEPDQLGTLRVDVGNSTLDVPIFAGGTSSADIEESLRIQLNNDVGYVPLAPLQDATYPELRVQQSSGTYGMHDAVEVSAIPDSVEYNWSAEDFASPWPPDVGAVDMTVSGLTSSTFSGGATSVTANGTDDYGLANGPESYGGNLTFGIAFTAEFSSTSFSEFIGVWDGGNPGNSLQIRTGVEGSDGAIELALADGANELRVYTDSTYDDGSTHAVIVNKRGDTANDISIYVDNMSSSVALSTAEDRGFNSTNYSINYDMGFYARNNAGSIDGHFPMDAGVFEFNSEPYSQSERDGFVTRRPEV